MYMPKEMQEKQRNRKRPAITAAIAIAVTLAGWVPFAAAFAQVPDESYLSGAASFISGNYGKAVADYTLAISRNNAGEDLFIRRGACYLKLQDTESAIRDFNEANAISAGVADLWLAKAYSLSGNTSEAVTFLESHLGSPFRIAGDIIKQDPDFDGLQTTNEWYNLWQKDWYGEEEKTIADVRYLLKKGQPDNAISVLDDRIVSSPASADLLTLRGEVNYSTGNYAAAIADLTAALNLRKNTSRNKYPPLEGAGGGYPPLEGAGGGLILRARSYLQAYRFKDAVTDLNRILREDPAVFPAYLLRAQANAGLKSYDAAIKDVVTYLKYFDNDLEAVYRCGEYHFLAEDYLNALKYFNRNLKEDPNNALYHKARGKTYLKSGTYRYAINDLSMSLDLNPDDAETWMYLGLAKIRTGDKVNGCSDLQRARQMGNTEALGLVIEECQ